MDIGGWLRSLGLEQYEATFRENAINEKVLPNLTADDLKDMGVGIVGHRRMLLDAIALLRADGSAKAPPAEASSTTLKPAQDTAERRQVTVMFSDLVGSTALSARMDPEDLREVISAYQKCVAETVQRFDGYVAKYMGDGVLVYFGYPQAHEDDAERAVRAGLGLIQAVGGLKSSAPLQTRVGIATGLVVVGDLIGSGAAQEQAPQLAKLASQRPVLMIFEDAHWTDPTSLEAFGRTVDQIKTLPALLIVTFRPEFNAPWAGRSHVTSVALNRLGGRETAAIIARLVGTKELPSDVMAEIVERTDGIPLFVEEMTKAVLEAESEGEAQRTAAAVPLSALAVPASLHASLMARLDRLGPAKEVAQIGAAIGREFSHALLAAVVHKPKAELGAALDRLMAAGLLFRQGVPPYASYRFKHALVQDAAYGTLLRESRRALHARIAETLEGQFAEIAENQPEILARHYTEAGLIEKAAGFWGKAGQRSLQRSALVEATEQLKRALGQIAALPATPALRREQIKLQVALITPLFHVKGYAAPETKAAAERARLLIEQAEALGEPPEDKLLLFSVLYSFWVANNVAFNGDLMRERAAQFLALAEKQGATGPLMIGHRLTGTTLLYTGEIAQGQSHFDQVLALYDPATHRPLATRFGQDARVATLTFRSLGLWMLGYPEAALADAEHALRSSREIGHAATLMYALAGTTLAHILCGNYSTANMQSDELIALADEKGGPFWKAFGMMNQGCVLALTSKASNAVKIFSSAIAAWRSTGSTLWLPLFLSYLSNAYAELDQLDDARRCIGEATTAIETTKEKWCEADIHRMAGKIAPLSPELNAAKAQGYFERALSVARAQQAKSWELRAAMSMARLWRDEGKRDEARELLAPVYGWFTEGFDTRDLKEAKALLEELAA